MGKLGHKHYTLNSQNRILLVLWTPARIAVVLTRLLSTLLPITVDPPFAFASSTLTPTFPSNSLGVSALAGPNIRLQSDRAGSARSLSPRPPTSGIFSERSQTPLTALLLAHYVRHVCMSSDGAQPETSCAVDVQLHKSDHVRDRQLCYASESSESLGIFFSFIELMERLLFPNAYAPRLKSCVNL